MISYLLSPLMRYKQQGLREMMLPNHVKARCFTGRVLHVGSVAGVLILSLATLGCDYVRNKCETETSTSFLSPEKLFKADLKLMVCSHDFLGGSYYSVTLAKTGNDLASAVEIFTSENAPVVTWQAEQALSIKVMKVEWISKSLHESDGIDINYSLAEGLTAASVIRSFNETDARIRREMDERSGGKPDRGAEAALAIRKDTFKRQLDQFKSWIRSNVADAQF